LIIDAHTHLLDTGHWPSEWWDWVAEDWARRGPGRQPSAIRDRIEQGLIDPAGARMVERMDQAGVDKSVLLPIDWGPDFTGTQPITAVVDKMLALAAAHPGRFVPFGGIDPRRDGAVDMVTEWFDRGIRGLKLYPGCGWSPTSDAAMAIYAACAERAAPVLFHTGHPLPVLDTEASNPILIKDVVRAFPELPVWLGHAGAPVWWAEALEVAKAGPNVRLEMSVWLWDDSGPEAELDFARKIVEVGDGLGFDRLMFGTDHVSGSRIRGPKFLHTIVEFYQRLPANAATIGRRISDDEMALIMGGVAAHDLGWGTDLAR
jgi:predicted TIM-barrel fold metal-dependent hydrolase